jgi:hypothetical protein
MLYNPIDGGFYSPFNYMEYKEKLTRLEYDLTRFIEDFFKDNGRYPGEKELEDFRIKWRKYD